MLHPWLNPQGHGQKFTKQAVREARAVSLWTTSTTSSLEFCKGNLRNWAPEMLY